jgi:hypothetical protein
MSTSIDIQLHTNQLSATVLAEMWHVYRPYYHYSEEYFYSRISNNTHYALYRKAGKLVGFTGLRLQTITVKDEKSLRFRKRRKRYFTIYFGQTVITEEVRSSGIINRTGILILKKYWKVLLSHRIMFWADALSYRAYLVFAKNLLAFYPSVKKSLPKEILQLRNKLGDQYYADRFCQETGTIRKDSYLIRDPNVVVTSDKLLDSDIFFYVQANPKYKEGYGLLTMGPASWENIMYMIGKAFKKSLEGKLIIQPTRPQTAQA